MRVQDILDAIASVQRLTAGLTFVEFTADEAIAKAVLYRTHLRSQEGAASRFSISLTKQRLILVVA